MSMPIEIKLPNGLIICMMPRERKRGFGAVKDEEETQFELNMRFIHALEALEGHIKGLVGLYKASLPVRHNSVTPIGTSTLQLSPRSAIQEPSKPTK